MTQMKAPTPMVNRRPYLSMMTPPKRAPNTAPPLKVAFMAPMMGDVAVVLKKLRKLGEAMTSVITPESYPNRNDLWNAILVRTGTNHRCRPDCGFRGTGGRSNATYPMAAKAAMPTLKSLPMVEV